MKMLLVSLALLSSSFTTSAASPKLDPFIEAGFVGIGTGTYAPEKLLTCGEGLVKRILSDSRFPSLNYLHSFTYWNTGHRVSFYAFDGNNLLYSGNVVLAYHDWRDDKIVCSVAGDTISEKGMTIIRRDENRSTITAEKIAFNSVRARQQLAANLPENRNPMASAARAAQEAYERANNRPKPNP